MTEINSHVVLDEPLDFVAGVFVLAEFHRAVFELVVESWWAEQDDSPVNQKNNNKQTENVTSLGYFANICYHGLGAKEEQWLGQRQSELLTLRRCRGSGGDPQSWCGQNGSCLSGRWLPSGTLPVLCSYHQQRTLGRKDKSC